MRLGGGRWRDGDDIFFLRFLGALALVCMICGYVHVLFIFILWALTSIIPNKPHIHTPTSNTQTIRTGGGA